MKNLICIATFMLALCSFQNLNAQTYKSIEWDIISLGYASPAGEGLSAGILMATEPRYNINDKFSAGLRLEFAIFGGGSDDAVDIGASGSFALMGDYYFSNNGNKRAFAGLGLGSFGGVDLTITNPDGTITEAEGGNSIGIVPRIGYELGFLRLSAEYNLAFDEFVSNYLGIKFGFTIGGRAK